MKPTTLLESMDMPEPGFPIKVHRCKADEYGCNLFRNHWHKHIELLYFVSGKAVIECNGNPIHAQAGDLIFVNSNDLHAGVCLSNNLFYYALIFDPCILQSQSIDTIEKKYMMPLIQNLILFPNQIEQPAEVADCFMSIVRELENREAGFELSVKSSLYRLIALLIRGNPALGQTAKASQKRMRELERFTPLLTYLENYFHEELNVEHLAYKIGLSRFHFSRLFKQLTDKSVMEYINDIRIHRAEYLLHNTRMTVTEIAMAVGFQDIYYFSRMFKKSRGMSPSEVRK
jgi:AraC-like DNA-binding protein